MTEIDKNFVWEYLTAGREVCAVVFVSKCWRSGMKNLQSMPVSDVNALLADNESDIKYFAKAVI